MKKCIYPLVIGLILAGLLSGCVVQNPPTKDSFESLAQYDKALDLFNRIEIGMSYDAAQALTDVKGESGSIESTAQADSGDTADVPQPPGYLWKFGDDAGRVSYYFLTAPASDPIGGKFFSWSSTDLSIRKDALTTADKFDQVEVGMTYAEVAATLGTPGRIIMAQYLVMEDKLVMTKSEKGFPVASVTTKVQEWTVYYWWVDATHLSADSFAITIRDGVVSDKQKV